MSVGDAPAGTISLAHSVADAQAWVGQKTPWLVERRYKRPFLVRARRIDIVGPVRFAKVFGQHLAELRFGANESNGRQGSYRFLASTSLFRAAGCYGFQIDGVTFSNVIVMRVVGNSTH